MSPLFRTNCPRVGNSPLIYSSLPLSARAISLEDRYRRWRTACEWTRRVSSTNEGEKIIPSPRSSSFAKNRATTRRRSSLRARSFRKRARALRPTAALHGLSLRTATREITRSELRQLTPR